MQRCSRQTERRRLFLPFSFSLFTLRIMERDKAIEREREARWHALSTYRTWTSSSFFSFLFFQYQACPATCFRHKGEDRRIGIVLRRRRQRRSISIRFYFEASPKIDGRHENCPRVVQKYRHTCWIVTRRPPPAPIPLMTFYSSALSRSYYSRLYSMLVRSFPSSRHLRLSVNLNRLLIAYAHSLHVNLASKTIIA